MPDDSSIEEHYRFLTDDELLALKHEGGFTPEAERVLEREFARRNLHSDDVVSYAKATERKNLREEVVERGGGYRRPGIQIFGKLYLNEADRRANIQVRTKWFTIRGIPVVPLASYRFKVQSKNCQRVINRVPLNWGQVFLTWIKTVGLCAAVVVIIAGITEIVHLLKR